MSENRNEPASIRAHLLNVEPPNVERMQQLQQEIQNMFTKSLTPSTRVAWSISLVVSLVFATGGIYKLWQAHQTGGRAEATGCLFTLTMLVNAILAARVLMQGFVNIRQKQTAQKILVPVTLIVAFVLIIQAIEHPTIAALGWALFGMIWVLIALTILLYNRVVTAELTTRESLLRLELRMIESAETHP